MSENPRYLNVSNTRGCAVHEKCFGTFQRLVLVDNKTIVNNNDICCKQAFSLITELHS